MNNKNVVFIIVSVVIIIFTFFIVNEVIPMLYENNIKNRIFNDMKDKSIDVIRGMVEIVPFEDTYNIKLSGIKGGKYEFTLQDENNIEYSFEYYFDKKENRIILKQKV